MNRINIQMFTYSGVYPTYGLTFEVGKLGLLSVQPTDFVTIKDMESFGLAIDGKAEEWTPMDSEGWVRRLITAKSLTLSMKGKRNHGDAGNDYVAGLAWKNGTDCSTKFEIGFPDGATLAFNCVISVKTPAGGDSTNVSGLEFDVLSDGKPTYTPGV